LLFLSAPTTSQEKKSGTTVYDWRQTVRLEHKDRVKRFQRLAAERAYGSPRFYEDWVRAADLPPQFGIDMPVLRVVMPQRVFFDTDRHDLRPEAMAVIQLVAENLKRDVPDVALFIAGHADSRGTDAHNYALSVDRADSVARALFSEGAGTAMIWRIGFGEAVPLEPNTTEAGMAANRRVEFLLASRPEAVARWMTDQSEKVCIGAPAAERAKCREKIDLMPPLTAVPILNDRKSKQEILLDRDQATIETDKTTVPLATERQTTSGIPTKQVVQIERNAPVVIDLKEKKVTVGRPEL